MTRGDSQLPPILQRSFAWLERRGFGPVLTTVPIVGLGFAALTLWGFSKLASEVLERETEAFDATILYALYALHTPTLDVLAKGVTFLGEPALLIAVTVLIGIILLVQRQVAAGIALPVAALGATGLNYLLKSVFARARPELWERSVNVNFYSFPSGHATGALVIYGFIGYLLAARMRPEQRILVILPTALLILMIGLSRLYLGVHWPTDVIGGYLAGLVWLTACIFTLRLWQARFPMPDGPVNPIAKDP